MTWIFLYAFLFLVGLLLAVATAMLRRLPFLAGHHNVVLPAPDHHAAALTRMVRCAGAGLAMLGVVGMLVRTSTDFPAPTAGVIALGAGAVTAILALLCVAPSCAETAAASTAVALRSIPPGGYGQVRIERDGASVMMAALNVGSVEIGQGADVRVVDCERSVLSVEPA